MTALIFRGDCREVLRVRAKDRSVDAIVCDPPYELAFMGKRWDASGVAYDMELWRECLRVLKPGGYLLAFGGTRTFHRMACAIEDAGFEIRDCIEWIYGSGFPKSSDVSKAIDKAQGAERTGGARTRTSPERYNGIMGKPMPAGRTIYDEPATDLAAQWRGWGTALKPAHEPIVVARKPLEGTVAANVLRYGTGGINVDGCRVAHASAVDLAESLSKNPGRDELVTSGVYGAGRPQQSVNVEGRWPANIVLSHSPACIRIGNKVVRSDTHYPASRGVGGIATSGHSGQDDLEERSGPETVSVWRCVEGCPVAELDRQSGTTKSVRATTTTERQDDDNEVYGHGLGTTSPDNTYSDAGGASRYFTVAEWGDEDDWTPFLYQAKASKRERNEGLEDREAVTTDDGRQTPIDNPFLRGETLRKNNHPTVKPVSLMRWLVRLVTPPGGWVMDPFTGSGTTGVAAVGEGMRFIGIEREPEYADIAEARIRHAEAVASPHGRQAEA